MTRRPPSARPDSPCRSPSAGGPTTTAVTDNSAALRRARRQDSNVRHRRAVDAIAAMEQTGEPISFPAVARQAGVSVSLLYADAELASRIATAHDRQRQAGRERAWRLPTRSLVTEQSLRADLANTKEQARRLTEEVAVLRDRLARQLGADADLARGRATGPLLELDQLEQRSTELETDNHRLRQQLTRAQAETRELTDTLAAARAMNRELMNELNRPDTSPPADSGRSRATRRADLTTEAQPCGYGTSVLARSDRLIWLHVATLSEVGVPAGSAACWPAWALTHLNGYQVRGPRRWPPLCRLIVRHMVTGSLLKILCPPRPGDALCRAAPVMVRRWAGGRAKSRPSS